MKKTEKAKLVLSTRITDVQDLYTHPEAKHGEVVFSNVTPKEFDLLNFTSKRKGQIAYDGRGNKLKPQSLEWFPVFIKIDEAASLGKTLTVLRREWREKMGY